MEIEVGDWEFEEDKAGEATSVASGEGATKREESKTAPPEEDEQTSGSSVSNPLSNYSFEQVDDSELKELLQAKFGVDQNDASHDYLREANECTADTDRPNAKKQRLHATNSSETASLPHQGINLTSAHEDAPNEGGPGSHTQQQQNTQEHLDNQSEQIEMKMISRITKIVTDRYGRQTRLYLYNDRYINIVSDVGIDFKYHSRFRRGIYVQHGLWKEKRSSRYNSQVHEIYVAKNVRYYRDEDYGLGKIVTIKPNGFGFVKIFGSSGTQIRIHARNSENWDSFNVGDWVNFVYCEDRDGNIEGVRVNKRQCQWKTEADMNDAWSWAKWHETQEEWHHTQARMWRQHAASLSETR